MRRSKVRREERWKLRVLAFLGFVGVFFFFDKEKSGFFSRSKLGCVRFFVARMKESVRF